MSISKRLQKIPGKRSAPMDDTIHRHLGAADGGSSEENSSEEIENESEGEITLNHAKRKAQRNKIEKKSKRRGSSERGSSATAAINDLSSNMTRALEDLTAAISSPLETSTEKDIMLNTMQKSLDNAQKTLEKNTEAMCRVETLLEKLNSRN